MQPGWQSAAAACRDELEWKYGRRRRKVRITKEAHQLAVVSLRNKLFVSVPAIFCTRRGGFFEGNTSKRGRLILSTPCVLFKLHFHAGCIHNQFVAFHIKLLTLEPSKITSVHWFAPSRNYSPPFRHLPPRSFETLRHSEETHWHSRQ